MAISRAAGHPNYGSGSTSNFVPALWSGMLAPKFYATTVFGAIANTDWEGEIKGKGDKVYIRVRPTIAIRDYDVGGGLNYEKPEQADVELLVDKAKYWGVEINDVDEYQSDINMMEIFSDDATEQMQIAVDTDVLGGIYSQAAATNAGTAAGAKSSSFNLGSAASAVSITSANVIDYITRHGAVLDEVNIPQQGRWMVLPPWMCYKVKNSDLKDASLAGDGTSILRNGRIGMIDRFEIYMSNNLTVTGSNTNIISGHSKGVTFASQITKVENLMNPNDFGTIVRGLNVYGYKVVNADTMTHGVVTPG